MRSILKIEKVAILTGIAASMSVQSIPLSAEDAVPSKARGATPVSISGWAPELVRNHPAEANGERSFGTVGVHLTVDRTGQVAACNAVRSSGSQVLDQAACDGMIRFARFSPALDGDGMPVEGVYFTSITYANDEGED